MRKINQLSISIVLIAIGMIYITACDNRLKDAPDLEDSLELFAGLELVSEAQNSLLRISQGNDLNNDGYFTIHVSNVMPNPIIKNNETEAWCLEWTKPLRSNNDVHDDVRWFSTTNNNKWKPLNYLFSIRKDLETTYENLTYREIQAVIWTLAGHMGIAPEFNIDKLSVSQLPSRLRSNGEVNFNRDFVREITARVLNEYPTGTINAGGFALQTANDEQNIFVPVKSTVVMANLNGPIGMTIGPDGSLYVAESGLPEINGPCVAVYRNSSNCFSGTGSVSRLLDNIQERFITGLPSAFNAENNDIIGPHHLSFNSSGELFVTIGWGGMPDARNGLNSLSENLGILVAITLDGNWNFVVDIAAFENNNPDGRNIDANPYGLLSESGRHYIIDAGGNTLLELAPNGNLSLVAILLPKEVPPGDFNPPFQLSEAVPTQVRRGPGGDLYVSTLTGVPFLPGMAGIYKILSDGTPEVYAGNLTHVTDFDWDTDGNLYVLQYASGPFLSGPGSLLHIKPDGVRKEIISNLANPTGLALGDDGSIYIVQKHNVAGGGEVVRYQ